MKLIRNNAMMNTIMIAGVFSLGVSALFTIVRFVSFVAANLASNVPAQLHTNLMIF